MNYDTWASKYSFGETIVGEGIEVGIAAVALHIAVDSCNPRLDESIGDS